MSAHVFTEEVDYYLCAGMNGFLGKPFSLEDLEHAIGQAIGGYEVIITNTSHADEQRRASAFDTSVVENDISRLGLESVEEYAALFFQSAEQLKAELIEAMEQGNFDKMASLAHRMNGAAGNFGLQRLCALLARIETQSNNETKLTTALLEQFQVEFDEAIAALTNYLSKQKVPPQNLSA
jgi:two-component system sensor histidine kinase TorS